MTTQGLPALLSGHGWVDLPHAQVVLESLACTGPHVGRRTASAKTSPRSVPATAIGVFFSRAGCLNI